MTTGLPTQQQIFINALESLGVGRNNLSEAQSWLKSDWAGVESGLTLPAGAGEHRAAARTDIAAAKDAIDRATEALFRALDHLR